MIASNNFANRAFGDTVILRKRGVGVTPLRIQKFYSSGLSVCQNRIGSFFSSTIRIAISLRCVPSIVSVGANIKMLRIATCRIVAFMKDHFPTWNFALHQLPRHSVCGKSKLSELEGSMPSMLKRSGIIPTITRSSFGNLVPEFIRHWSPSGFPNVIGHNRYCVETNSFFQAT